MGPQEQGALVAVSCKRCGRQFWTGSGAKVCQDCCDSTARVKARNKRRAKESAGQTVPRLR